MYEIGFRWAAFTPPNYFDSTVLEKPDSDRGKPNKGLVLTKLQSLPDLYMFCLRHNYRTSLYGMRDICFVKCDITKLAGVSHLSQYKLSNFYYRWDDVANDFDGLHAFAGNAPGDPSLEWDVETLYIWKYEAIKRIVLFESQGNFTYNRMAKIAERSFQDVIENMISHGYEWCAMVSYAEKALFLRGTISYPVDKTLRGLKFSKICDCPEPSTDKTDMNLIFAKINIGSRSMAKDTCSRTRRNMAYHRDNYHILYKEFCAGFYNTRENKIYIWSRNEITDVLVFTNVKRAQHCYFGDQPIQWPALRRVIL